EIKRLLQMLIDQPAKALRQFRLWIAKRRFVWTATQACAKACLPGGFRKREKEYIFAFWLPRGAGWATIHTGGAHAVIKQPVTACVPFLDGLPKLVFHFPGQGSCALLIHRIRHISDLRTRS